MKENTEESSDPYGRISPNGISGEDSASTHHQCMQSDRKNVSMNQKNLKVRDDTLLLESNASSGSSSNWNSGKDLSFRETMNVPRRGHSGKTEISSKGNSSSFGVSGRPHESVKWVQKGAHSGKSGCAGEGNSSSVADSGRNCEFRTGDVPGRVQSEETAYAGTHKYDTRVITGGAHSRKIGYTDEGNSCSVADFCRTGEFNTSVVPRRGGGHSGKIKYAGKGNSYSVAVSGSNTVYTGKVASGGARAEKTGYADKGKTYSLADSDSFRELSQPSMFDVAVEVINSEESSQKRRADTDVQAQDSVFCYDICPLSNGSGVRLKVPLHLKNREIRNEKNRADGVCVKVLRPGMLLLKHYISLNDQVKVIRTCRDLGVGPGGFYLPGYQDGAKLRLKMMCLGKNWDPETSKYGDFRPYDGSKPPPIPDEFHALVLKAIKASHSHLRNSCRARRVEDILPSMTPNICIANFYTKTGKLGLHQDKDESRDSLSKGLPVVSFSIGDSAEFLYGDQRDVNKVENVVLESGDVLIFGGKARHVYHGISTIFADTAPKYLLEETNLRPGRLNLTFREY